MPQMRSEPNHITVGPAIRRAAPPAERFWPRGASSDLWVEFAGKSAISAGAAVSESGFAQYGLGGRLRLR
jgi:hypothetical protein